MYALQEQGFRVTLKTRRAITGNKKKSPEAPFSATLVQGTNTNLQQIDGLKQAINFTINATY